MGTCNIDDKKIKVEAIKETLNLLKKHFEEGKITPEFFYRLFASLSSSLRALEKKIETGKGRIKSGRTKRMRKIQIRRVESEPVLDMADYEHIISVIQNMGLVMERGPRAFVNINEEDLRQHFLVQLNGHYEGQATGETFNYKGKTDILVRVEGKNIFVGECKFWTGEKGLRETIDQILRNTSWRDTKTALLLFSRNRDFSTVLSEISRAVKSHPSYKRTLKIKGETMFRYLLNRPNESNRKIFLTVVAFDIPK